MAKPEWGSKRVCQSCGGRFYDLLRDPIVCPHCGAELQATSHQRGRRNRPAVGGAQPAAAAGSGESIENGVPLAEVEEADLEDESDETIDDGTGGNDVSDVI